MRRDGFIMCLQILHALVQADAQLVDEEARFIERLMEHLRFSADERAAAREPVDLEAGSAMLRGLSRPLREGLFRTLVRAAGVDGHVDARESGFISRLADAAGVSPATLDALWRASGAGASPGRDEAAGGAPDADDTPYAGGALAVARALGEGWDEAIRRGLAALIARHGRGGDAHDPASPPIAAFDMDNTCIEGDIGELALAYLEPEEGQALVAEYERLARDVDPPTAYRWAAEALGGRDEAALGALCEAIFARAEVTGAVACRAPMQRLLRVLDARGWQVWIVSASLESLVAAAASRFGVAAERVVGMRLEVDPQTGHVGRRAVEPWTLGAGKVTALEGRARGQLHLAAGDSDNDLALLERATHALVIDRGAPALARVAAERGWWVQGGWSTRALV